jgi:hypothetical protein
MRKAPEIVTVDSRQLDELLRRVDQSLDEKDSELIRAVFRSYAYVTDLVEDKNTSIRRLRQLFFGARTEKTKTVVGDTVEKAKTPPASGAAAPREFSEGEVDPDVSDGKGDEPAEGSVGSDRVYSLLAAFGISQQLLEASTLGAHATIG